MTIFQFWGKILFLINIIDNTSRKDPEHVRNLYNERNLKKKKLYHREILICESWFRPNYNINLSGNNLIRSDRRDTIA